MTEHEITSLQFILLQVVAAFISTNLRVP